MKMNTIECLLEDQLKDLYSAEGQLIKALPKIIQAASTPELKQTLENHLQETQEQFKRLERIGELLDLKLKGKKCKAMEGLIEESKEVFEMTAPDSIIDAAIISSAQRIEHYEISGYGTARALAEHLGHSEVATLLNDTLDEESQADEKLTAVCQQFVLPASNIDASDETGMDKSSFMDDEEDVADDDSELSSSQSRTRHQ